MTFRDYSNYSNEELVRVILFETLGEDKMSKGWTRREPDYQLKRILRGYNVYYTNNDEGIWIHKHLPDYIG
jgi:hypothetical protein